MSDNQLFYTLALQHVRLIGDVKAKKLIAHCGAAEAIFKEKRYRLEHLDGIGSALLNELYKPEHFKAAEAELRYIQDNHIKYLFFTDKDYPDKLKHCVDGPVLLFYSGNINLHNKRIISIVGTRMVTTYGVGFTERLIETLAPFNPVIVSGFAYGVDITAQKAAVKHGLQTVGCLAHGLNQIYPKAHKKYVAQVEQNGGFFTEFWSSSKPERENFLRRNRVIAGMSEATIVIESAEKGGSLVTADIANSYNRDVFALPGRATDSQSIGCNNLIKFQKAHLLSNPLDIAYMLNWDLDAQEPKSVVQKQLFVELEPDEKTIYNYLNEHQKTLLDVIALECNIPTFKTASLLLNMELKGVVRPLPGKLFEVI
jgi:DNA processing protein